jgi:hypothetical protein
LEDDHHQKTKSRSAEDIGWIVISQVNARRGHDRSPEEMKALPSERVDRPLTPEEEANHGLTMLVMTTLVEKMWEGWKDISEGEKLRPALNGLPLAAFESFHSSSRT